MKEEEEVKGKGRKEGRKKIKNGREGEKTIGGRVRGAKAKQKILPLGS